MVINGVATSGLQSACNSQTYQDHAGVISQMVLQPVTLMGACFEWMSAEVASYRHVHCKVF